MALIKINDLNLVVGMPTGGNRVVNSDWIELKSHEMELVHGGRRFRSHFHAAANNLINAVNSQIESISGTSNLSDSFRLTISQSNSGGQSSTSINGVEVETNGNLFYTSSGIAPTGGVPIPGVPGAYTF